MMLKNTYYFLRHAQADRSEPVHFSAHALSAAGQTQAEQLVGVLSPLQIERIYVSPFKRAQQTVAPFSQHARLNAQMDERLSGRLVGQVGESEIDLFFKKSWDDFNYSELGAESAYTCIARVQSFIAECEERFSGKTILAVSHSNPIAFFLSTLSDTVGYAWFRQMPTPALYKVWGAGQFGEISFLTNN